MPNFEDETYLLEVEILKDRCSRLKKNFKLLITDYSVVLTSKDNADDQDDSFLIKEIDFIIKAVDKDSVFILNVKDRPSYFFSTRKAEEAIELLKSLYTS